MGKKQNTKLIDLSSINVTCISTSRKIVNNEYVKMYIITFLYGNKTVSQTKHMTEKQMMSYKKSPSIDAVSNAGKKGLQTCHINLKKGEE